MMLLATACWEHVIRHRAVACLIFCCLGAHAAATDTRPTVSDGGTAATNAPLQVSASVGSVTPVAYFDPVFLNVTVTALEGFDFGRPAIAILMLGELEGIYDTSGVGKSQVERCPGAPSGLVPGQTITITCQIGSPGSWTSRALNGLLLTKPATRRVLVRVQQDRGDQAGPMTFDTPVDIPFTAPRLAVFYGGLFGAFLLSLFTVVRSQIPASGGVVDSVNANAISTQFSVRTLIPQLLTLLLALIRALWRIVMVTVLGGICALLVILLAQTTEGFAPPVSLRVQDFWGGTIIGLFSLPLSRWLAEQLSKVK